MTTFVVSYFSFFMFWHEKLTPETTKNNKIQKIKTKSTSRKSQTRDIV